MTNLLKLSVACLLAGVYQAQAQSANSKTGTAQNKIEAEKLHEEAKKSALPTEEDADQIITNKKLRADTGSKSKWSVKTAINYSGSTLEKPFDKSRPNITKGTTNSDFATLGGTIAVKRNINARNSLSFGGGVRWLTPMEAKAPTSGNKQLDKMDIYDPSVTYQRIGKIGNVQSVTAINPQFITRSDKRSVGFQSVTDFTQIFAYELKSGVTIGGLFVLSGRTFDKSKNDIYSVNSTTGKVTLLGDVRGDYLVGAYPFLEYQINDRYGLRTISGVYVYEHSNMEPRALTFSKNVIYQSVGLGISITRDIYLYPNIQFIPEDIRADRTNVALNTSINLF